MIDSPQQGYACARVIPLRMEAESIDKAPSLDGESLSSSGAGAGLPDVVGTSVLSRSGARWAWLAPLVVLSPFLLLSFFAQPSADEFCYADTVRRQGFLGMQLREYQTWSGRFAHNLLYGVLGLQDPRDVYFLVPLTVFVGLGLGFVVLSRILLRPVARKRDAVFVGVCLFALYVTLVPSPSEGFYWFGGAMTGQLACLCALFSAAAMTTSAQRAVGRGFRIGGILVAGALSAWAIGLYESSYALFFVGCIGVFLARRSRRFKMRAAAVLIFASIAFAVVALAPGTAIRMERVGGASLIRGILKASYYGTFHFVEWSTEISLLAAALLMLPAVCRLVRETSKAEAAQLLAPFQLAPFQRVPAQLVVRISLTFVAVLGVLLPTYYATGSSPGRVNDVAFFAFFVGAVWSFFAFVETNIARQLASVIAGKRFLRIALGVLLAGSLATRSHWYDAVKDLALRTAGYRAQLEARYATIEDAKSRGVMKLQVPALEDIPRTIYFTDLTDQPQHWRNRCQARFFGLSELATEKLNAVQRGQDWQ
ncbi:MAG: hypothetical protein H6729_11155 [Deltaproteobacteria bacterium]|nr:hypothetical protein [Deltaproteobacteria bacterium]